MYIERFLYKKTYGNNKPKNCNRYTLKKEKGIQHNTNESHQITREQKMKGGGEIYKTTQKQLTKWL